MKFEQRIEVDAPPEAVWEACADPAQLAGFVGSAMTVTPAEEGQKPALDGRYRIHLKLGAALVGGDIIIVDFTPAREFAWNAFTGVDHRLRLRFRPLSNGRTALTLRFSYDAPGVLGTVADLAAYPKVHSMFTNALEAAKLEVEHRTAPQPAPPSLPRRAIRELTYAGVLARRGIVRPMRPDTLFRLAWAARTWGLSLGTAVAAGAIRSGGAPLIVDEFGTQTYAEVDERSNAIASGLALHGVTESDTVGVLARNHRGFLEAATAVAKVGADVLLLNTEFSGPQLREVTTREAVSAVIYDTEFHALMGDSPMHMLRVFSDADPDGDAPSLASFAVEYHGRRPPVPNRSGKLTILTSGTTGTPKGATRGAVAAGGTLTLEAPAALLGRIPLRAGMRIGLAAPAFHAWGLANLVMALGLGASVVMLRRFSAEEWLAEIDRSKCEAFIAIPVMLQRILDLPKDVRDKYDTSSLEVVAVSGSALAGDLATRWMDSFGDNLYNLYGSTEVANATIATPQDLRTAPGTAGRPTRGTTVRLFDQSGKEVRQGETGRIYVGNAHLFEGYTGGGDKERIGGLMATGDLGRFDEAGRLFVVGRDDEMIVSGGENVYPREVEDVIARHASVAEAACVGVDDDKFGQRLRAFVVLRDGETLSADEVKDLVRAQLARYKVPRDIEFLDALPRNAAGKIVKRQLLDT
ncbi:AMP-binding protein [Hoyosella subflava]|uniref:AMP-dependent synthetase and ligase n=1 Tax=Hoyosella subflava (strain DSM 45089 / JCM 17490 / NBRC 109087 / DQS3-9A1) TaxID=443218 RepID=F6EEQ8_HOYSD|nr:AMP-binding protein [Hoyosella subflava]AEF40858.1 AMP-dependent synthetase and ligase [Hoyosella subflava DQS3-9A1]